MNVTNQTIFAHMDCLLFSLASFCLLCTHYLSSTGRGRFLIMGHNQTPHFTPDQYETMRTGGSLKDGWSYLMPNDKFILDVEVSVAFRSRNIMFRTDGSAVAPSDKGNRKAKRTAT
jgi:hypothetical protein